MTTSAQVVEASVNVASNSPSQDYTHPDDHNLPNYDMTPGFKPFTVLNLSVFSWRNIISKLVEAKEGPILKKSTLRALLISMGLIYIVSSNSSSVILVVMDSFPITVNLFISLQTFFMFPEFSLKLRKSCNNNY